MRGDTRVGRRSLRAHAVSALLLVPLFALAPQSLAADLSVYGKLPAIEDVVLSGDGSRIAYLRTQGDERVVTVYTTDGHKPLRMVKVGHQKIRWIEWADADHLLITESWTGVAFGYTGPPAEWYVTWVFNARDGSFVRVPQSPGRNVTLLNFVFGRPDIRHIDGHTVLFLRAWQATDTPALALVRFDLQTGVSHIVQPAHEGIERDWVIDNAGEIAAEESYNPYTREWRIAAHRDGHNRDVAGGRDHIEYPEIVGWGPDDHTVLVKGSDRSDSVWQLLSLNDGTMRLMDGQASFDVPIYDSVSHRLIGAEYVEDSSEFRFFDTVTRYSWEMVLGAFPGERVTLESCSDDFRKFVVRVESREKGYRFVLVDLDAHHMMPLGDIYEGVKPYEVRRINYTATDGIEIPAYLTLPDRPAKNLPLVVLPHGGPEARDTIDFDWWSQALASLGYAVLRPNYRGSALGWDFVSKGFGEWGRKMQTDLSDGVRALAKQGVVDAKRVCIVGGSYGGYAALAGPSLDPGVYRCAVSVAGIADVRPTLGPVTGRLRHRFRLEQDYNDRYLGISAPTDPLVNAISPIKHVDAVNVPILLIHGRDDTVVPYRQSQVMYEALKAANKEVQFVTLQHEDHWLSRGETRLQMLQATASFLLANNPPN